VLVTEPDVPRCGGPLPPIIHYPRSGFGPIITELTENVQNILHLVCSYFDILQGNVWPFTNLFMAGRILRGEFTLKFTNEGIYPTGKT